MIEKRYGVSAPTSYSTDTASLYKSALGLAPGGSYQLPFSVSPSFPPALPIISSKLGTSHEYLGTSSEIIMDRLMLSNSNSSNSSNEEEEEESEIKNSINNISSRQKSIISHSSYYPDNAKYQCSYRNKCFRSNPKHFEKYSHPITHPFVKNILHPNNNNNEESFPIPNVDSTSTTEEDLTTIESSGNLSLSNSGHVFNEDNLILGQIHFDPVNKYYAPASSIILDSSGSFPNNNNSINTYKEDNELFLLSKYLQEESISKGENNVHSIIDNLTTTQLKDLLHNISSNLPLSSYNSESNILDKDATTTATSTSPSTSTTTTNNYGVSNYSTLVSGLPDSIDWNEEFQESVKGIKTLSPNTRQDIRMQIYERLVLHCKNFESTAKTYGKIIITEVYMDPRRKTIKPLQGKGFAGGDKYYVHGIYFKFAVDSTIKLYGADDGAMKVAGHELRHLIQVFNCWIKDIYLPMSVLVDYRGFRLVAMSTLPITNTTLVFGASDASKDSRINMSNADIIEKMKILGKKLNLKEHGIAGNEESIKIYTPLDLEAHRGLDNKYYLLDFARLMPPTLPDSSSVSYLVNLFRPEFVKRYSISLCPDAYSSFISPNERDLVNNDIQEATFYLKSKLVSKFANEISNITLSIHRIQYPLLQSLHAAGINIRYIGLVRSHLESSEIYWRHVLLVEMISRVIKQNIRTKLRDMSKNLKQPGDEPYKQTVITELNLIFSKRKTSIYYWKVTLKEQLIKKFGSKSLSSKELENEYSLKTSITGKYESELDGRSRLFKLLCDYLGLEFAASTYNSCLENPNVFDFQKPFDETDLVDIRETMKYTNIAIHSEGFVLKMKAAKKSKEEATRLYNLAIDRFKMALASNPDNKNSLRNLADCYTLIGT